MSASRTAKPKGRAVFRGRGEHRHQPAQPTMTFVRVPVDVPAVFGRERPAVSVTVAKYTYRSTVRANAKAKARWDTLSFTHERDHADAIAIANAKKPETRLAKLEK